MTSPVTGTIRSADQISRQERISTKRQKREVHVVDVSSQEEVSQSSDGTSKPALKIQGIVNQVEKMTLSLQESSHSIEHYKITLEDLKKAVEENNREILKVALQSPQTDKSSLMFIAAINGNTELVEKLVKSGVDVNTLDKYEFTPLHFASYGGHRNCMELLVANGANIEARNLIRHTPLYYAAEHGHKDCLDFLFRCGADINVRNRLGGTPLDFAVIKGHNDCVEFLLINGAESETNLSIAVEHSPVLKVLLSSNRNKNYNLADFARFLKDAVRKRLGKGKFEAIIQILKDHGFRINMELLEALKTEAIKVGAMENFLSLNKEGITNSEIDFLARKKFEQFFNMATSGGGQKEDIQKFWNTHIVPSGLSKSILEHRLVNNRSIFLEAASSGNLPFLKWYHEDVILSEGSNIKTLDQQKCIHETGLMLAVAGKHFDAIEWLMAEGSDPDHLFNPVDLLDSWTDAEKMRFDQIEKSAKETIVQEIAKICFSRVGKQAGGDEGIYAYLPLNKMIVDFIY